MRSRLGALGPTTTVLFPLLRLKNLAVAWGSGSNALLALRREIASARGVNDGSSRRPLDVALPQEIDKLINYEYWVGLWLQDISLSLIAFRSAVDRAAVC